MNGPFESITTHALVAVQSSDLSKLSKRDVLPVTVRSTRSSWPSWSSSAPSTDLLTAYNARPYSSTGSACPKEGNVRHASSLPAPSDAQCGGGMVRAARKGPGVVGAGAGRAEAEQTPSGPPANTRHGPRRTGRNVQVRRHTTAPVVTTRQPASGFGTKRSLPKREHLCAR
jgi:hypothetical protein